MESHFQMFPQHRRDTEPLIVPKGKAINVSVCVCTWLQKRRDGGTSDGRRCHQCMNMRECAQSVKLLPGPEARRDSFQAFSANQTEQDCCLLTSSVAQKVFYDPDLEKGEKRVSWETQQGRR